MLDDPEGVFATTKRYTYALSSLYVQLPCPKCGNLCSWTYNKSSDSVEKKPNIDCECYHGNN